MGSIEMEVPQVMLGPKSSLKSSQEFPGHDLDVFGIGEKPGVDDHDAWFLG